MTALRTRPAAVQPVRIPWQGSILDGDLVVPRHARGVVLFAHGSGSSRRSPRNRFVAEALQEAGFATLLMDLLTHHEAELDAISQYFRFDIDLMARRMEGITYWLCRNEDIRTLPVGYFGASTGAGAALMAAAECPSIVRAIVSRGGRPDLACGALPRVHAPTLFIVGGHDPSVMPLNVQAMEQIEAEECRLEIIPNATHLFEQNGALEQVALSATDWYSRFLTTPVEAERSAVAVG